VAGKLDKTSIGRLRYRCDLKSPTDTSDGAGGRTQAYSTIAQIYADIRPTGGDEAYRQGRVQTKITHKIHMRYRADMSADYIIVYENRTFQIQNIRNIDERDRFFEITATEGVAH